MTRKKLPEICGQCGAKVKTVVVCQDCGAVELCKGCATAYFERCKKCWDKGFEPYRNVKGLKWD